MNESSNPSLATDWRDKAAPAGYVRRKLPWRCAGHATSPFQHGEPVATFSTSREIPASVEQVFAVFSNPERLARWRGPAGFTNTFSLCEFKQGGRWSFVMHGPDGVNYPNENVFAEIEAPNKVVVQHVLEPKFRLTIALASSTAGLAG